MKGINVYLTFDGNAREAVKFYAECLGANLTMMTFGEANVPCPDSAKNRIMHAKISKGNAVFMASDTMPGMVFQQGNNVSVNISCDSIQEIEKIFLNFNRDANITMPLQETFWATRYGMLKDKFGINWMFNLDKAKQ